MGHEDLIYFWRLNAAISFVGFVCFLYFMLAFGLVNKLIFLGYWEIFLVSKWITLVQHIHGDTKMYKANFLLKLKKYSNNNELPIPIKVEKEYHYSSIKQPAKKMNNILLP